jgi:hypothetical protein
MTRYSIIDRDAHEVQYEVVRSGFETEFEALLYIERNLEQPGRFFVHGYEPAGDHWSVMEDTWPEYESVMEMEKYQ